MIVNIVNIIETQTKQNNLSYVKTLTELKDEIQQNGVTCDILILDLNFPDGSSVDYITKIKEIKPEVVIIVISAQSEIRTAIRALDSGADSYICKGESFNSDLIVALKNGLKQISLNEKNQALKNSIFVPEIFPLVLFKISEMGVDVIFQDFNTFPEEMERDTHSFLGNLGISFSMVLSSDNEYLEGVFSFPAGASKLYRVLLFTFRIPDKSAVDQRLRLGFFQLCLFFPKTFISILPPVDDMAFIIEFIKTEVTEASLFSPDFIVKLKTKILLELSQRI